MLWVDALPMHGSVRKCLLYFILTSEHTSPLIHVQDESVVDRQLLAI